MAEVTRKRLARNSIAGIAAAVWRIISRYVFTPIVIASVGLEGYGAWTLLFSLTAYVGMINQGFGTAYSKLTAELDARGEYAELAEAVGSGVAIMGGMAALAGIVFYAAGRPALVFLGLDGPLLEEASRALLLVVGAAAIGVFAGCVRSTLEGLQRMDLGVQIAMGASMVEIVCSIVLLLNGLGIVGLAIGFLSGQLTGLVVGWWLCHRVESRVRISPFRASRRGIRRIVGAGSRFQVLTFLWTLIREAPKLLISPLLGVEFVGIHELAQRLLGLGKMLGLAVVGPLMSAFANLHVTDATKGRVERLHAQSSRAVALTTGLCFAFLFVFADDAILIWTGESYPLASWTLRVIVFGQFLHSLTGVGTASLRAQGLIGLEMLFALGRVGLMAGLMAPMYLLWGYKGLVGATAIAAALAPLGFLVVYARREQQDLGALFRISCLEPAFAMLPAAALTFALRAALTLPSWLEKARYQAIAEVMLFGLVFASVAGAATWSLVLRENERKAALALVIGRSAPAKDTVRPGG